MESYLEINAYAPEWIQNFSCLGGKCPQTCCRGWNIPVDEEHALFYENINDPELLPIISKVLRKIRTKKHQKSENLYFLHLLDQPDDSCSLLNKERLCILQNKYGASLLCTTCYFFPKILWQIDDVWSLSASFSCPEVLRMAILNPKPIQFTTLGTDQDPQAEWLETSLINDADVRFILLNRQVIVSSVIRIIQDRRYSVPDRIYNACQFLLFLEKSVQTVRKNGSEILSEISSDDFNSLLPAGIIPSDSIEKTTEWIRNIDFVFNWGMESNAKYHRDIQNDFSLMLCKKTDPYKIIAENYLTARNKTYLPFIKEKSYLIENFFVHYIFSDMLKQFSIYQNENVEVAQILNYEITQLCAVYALIQFLLVKQSLIAGEMNNSEFLNAMYQADRSYLHYPAFIIQSISRLPETIQQDKYIRMLLSC
jgi:lysine-N-methylase